MKKMFAEMDEELFLSCERKFEEEEDKLIALEEKRRITWERLETAAASQPVTGNTAVLVTPITTPKIASSFT